MLPKIATIRSIWPAVDVPSSGTFQSIRSAKAASR